MGTIIKLTPRFTKCNIQYGNFGFKKKKKLRVGRMGTITKLTPLFTKCNIQYGNFGFKKNLRVGTGRVLGPPVNSKVYL